MMVLAMILHVCRVFLTGGFKRPRELTWVTGVTMAVCTVSFGVTGYLLPWDQVGYWAVKIVQEFQMLFQLLDQQWLNYYCVVLVNQHLLVSTVYTLFYLINCCIYVNALLMIRKQGISGPHKKSS
jgi:cytochrome b6